MRHILGDQYDKPGKFKTEAEKKKEEEANKKELEKIDEKEEEPMIEELTEEQAKEEEAKIAAQEAEKQKQKEEEESKMEDEKPKIEEPKPKTAKKATKFIDDLKTITEGISLGAIAEGDNEDAKEEGTRELLEGFKQLNLKLHFLSDDLSKIYGKQKYQGLFDIAVASINAGDFLEDSVLPLFKPGSKLFVETVDTLCILRKEQK